MKKTIIQTGNRNIYDNLNLLKHQNEVVIDNVLKKAMGRIKNNFNRNGNNISISCVGTQHKIKKLQPLKFEVYLK